MFSYFMKNAVPYRYESGDTTISRELLEEFVPKLKHIDIKPTQKESHGFSSVIGYENESYFIHQVGVWFLLSVTFEEKKIKKNKLSKRLNQKKNAINQKKEANGEPALTTEEIEELKAKAYSELLVETEATENFLNIVIDTHSKMIFFSESNSRLIKIFTALIKKKIEEFSLSSFIPHGIELHLTQWLYKPDESLPSEMSLEDATNLVSDQSSKATLRKQNLRSEEIQLLINHGKKCQALSVLYLERLYFTLHADCQIKGIAFNDVLMSEIDVIEEPINRLEEFIPYWDVMCSELSSFFIWLEEVSQKPV